MLLTQLRTHNPLVICLTNDVVKNFTANGLLALGAAPVMSRSLDDVAALMPHAHALLVNLGTLDADRIAFYRAALALARSHSVKTVLDPVGCATSPFRLQAAHTLIEEHPFDVIRGNAGEIAALLGLPSQSKGVASKPVPNSSALVSAAQQQLHTAVVATGPIDTIATHNGTYSINNGSTMMPLVAGTGCLLGAVIAACIGVPNISLETALCDGVAAFAIAGELAHTPSSDQRPGTYQMALLDALHLMDDTLVQTRKQVQHIV